MTSATLIGAACLALTATAVPPVQTDDAAPSADRPTNQPSVRPESPSIATGSLAVRAVQGTPGGPSIGATRIRVELYHRNMLVDSIDDELDEHGVVMFENLPAGMGVIPVVQVEHAGVTFQQSGNELNIANPNQTIEVVCYEVTADAPEWTVPMRHVMVSTIDEGIRVTEMMVVENPGDRAWLGELAGEDRRATTIFLLPDSATNIRLGPGFHDWCCTTLADGKLINHLPLMPNASELRFSYDLPLADAEATLDIVAPAAVERMMVVVPEDISVETASGLEPAGVQSMGDGQVNTYTRTDVRPGEQTRLILSAATTVGATPPVLTEKSGGAAKLIALIGGGVILLAGLVLVLSRSAGSSG